MSRIKELRKKKGLTQIHLQEMTGIDQGDLSKIENGLRALSLKYAIRIARALGTNEDYLLLRSDNPDPRTE